jgi:Reverse transcriptase (RNA-dependent DNA polymerase)
MAELARNYHSTLQDQGINENKIEEIEANMEEVLREIPENQEFQNPDTLELNFGITEDHVDDALKLAKNGSATGLDGCPYELWKELKKWNEEAVRDKKRGFNIIKVLTIVFQDVQHHEIAPETDFADRWMCPIYKKKDTTSIENYRPITLLNLNYKLLTKVLALQLINDVKMMIHHNQAGFIPGRLIFDHISLMRIMTKFMETSAQNGAILALDQEEEYDKIMHQYLWKTMEGFDMLKLFMKTVKNLYTNTWTTVTINGEFRMA